MEILEILKAVLFGIIQGITEWLPISSTGHMILADQFVKLNLTEPFFKNVFLVVIQFGSIMAVVVLFWNKLFPFSAKEQYFIKKETFVMWFKIFVACVPAAIVGVLWDDEFEELFYNPVCVAIALIVFGVLFIVVENMNHGKRPKITSINQITYQTAAMIGLFQLIAAVFPGTSRSGATIVGALLLGVSRYIATEFTFFLAVPVMLGASLLKLVKYGNLITPDQLGILIIGMVVAFFVSIVAIKFLVGFVQKHDFKVFGWYRIALGLFVVMYFYFINL